MEISNGLVLTIKGKKYVILAALIHEDNTYVITNEVEGEETLTEDYYIFRIIKNDAEKIIDEQLINVLFPKFQQKLKETIESDL